MATKKKSKNNTNTELKSDEIESTTDVDPKIELISSSEPNINAFSDDLQSEIDLFESELNESLEIETEPEPVAQDVKEVTEKKAEPETQELENAEKEKVIEEPESEPEKPKKTRTRKSRKTKKSENDDSEKTEETKPQEEEITEKPKKSRSRKSKKAKEPEKKDTEFQEDKNTEVSKETTSPEKSNVEEVQEPVKNIVEDEIVDINLLTDSISDPKVQASVLVLYNEKAELKANLEKSKKILRILKRKLDLAEEKGEQWKACAYTLGDFFASKSNMPLEDVLRRFEAPIEEDEL